MRILATKRGGAIGWISILAIFCVALILVTGILQVTHTHAAGQFDHDCSVCFTAHQAVQVAFLFILLLISRPVAHFRRDRFAPLPRQRFVLKLANRPPPVPAAFS